MARPNCKLVSRHSYDPSRHKYFVSRRSQTVPDMNYSIRTLLDRYQRNPAPVDMSHMCEYDEEIDTDIIRNNYESENFETVFSPDQVRDLTDISDAKRELRQIQEEEKRKRVERSRHRKTQTDPASGKQGEHPASPASTVEDGKSAQK